MRDQFEPGDRVKIVDPEDFREPGDAEKVWTVLKYPWKQWRDFIVFIGDEGGRERAVSIKHLEKVGTEGGCCSNGYCELGG